MKLTLIVDLAKRRAIFKRGQTTVFSEAGERWLQFFGRLALAQRRGDSWVTAHSLWQLQAWRRLKEKNVGKIVARYLDGRPASDRFLDTNGKTVRWRIRSDVDLRLIQDEIGLRVWLQDRGLARRSASANTPWLQQIVRAQIAFHRGEIREAIELSAAARQSADDERTLRISALLLLRAEDARGRLQEARSATETFLAKRRAVTQPTPENIWGNDALGLQCRARLAVMEALRGDKSHGRDHAAALRAALESADTGGDLGRQTILCNALGILAWRRGDFDDAREFLYEAISFALATNDLFTLGGAMFNLALADLMAQKAATGRVCSDLAQQLLTLCSELDAKAVVGRSSAQAEILSARLHVGAGRFGEAERLVTVAEAMVRRTGSPYDQGCLSLARTELVWARALKGFVDRDIAKRRAAASLAAAIAQFANVPTEGEAYARNQLQRLHAGLGVALPWSSNSGKI